MPFAFIAAGGGGGGRGTGSGAPATAAAPGAGGAGPGRGESAFPEGFNPKPSPYGVSFTGMACSEPRLIELAYAFEQATKRRVPPKL